MLTCAKMPSALWTGSVLPFIANGIFARGLIVLMTSDRVIILTNSVPSTNLKKSASMSCRKMPTISRLI